MVFLLDIQDYRVAVRSGPFGAAGKLVYHGDDPASTYNLAIGKIVLLLWEYVDILRLWNVLEMPWCLSDFVSRKVSSSVTSLFRFSRTIALTRQTLTELFISDHLVYSSTLCTLFSCIRMSFCTRFWCC